MSNRSSVLDESFIERKSGRTSIANTTGAMNTSATMNRSFGSGSLPMGDVSPFQRINPLVESPFRQGRFYPLQREREAERGKDNSDSYDESILRRKVRAHQKRYQETVHVETPLEIDSNTYLQSAFGSKKRIYDSQKNQQDRSKLATKTTTTLNRDINNPYFTEALGRIVNKELELRKLLFAVLAFAVSRLVRSLVRLFVYTHPEVHHACDTVSSFIRTNMDGLPFSVVLASAFTFENVLLEASYVDTAVSAILLFVVATSAYRLLKPQDKCLDLPLSNAQRKVLGLTVEEAGNEESDELNDEEEAVKRLYASPKRMEQPVQVVVPDAGSLDGVMGSLGGLDLRGSASNSTGISSSTSISANITPSGKYLYDTRSELQGNRSFY